MSTSYTLQSANEERRRVYHEADVVVVGAGIFGCAIAYALAKQGRSVLLLERWLKEPDRIVGELLQPGGVSALEKLGLSHCLEDIDSIVVKGYEVIYHGTAVTIPYPMNAGATAKGGFKDSENEKSTRPEGRSFHHGRFISQLRKACASQPNITIVETEVTDTITGGPTGAQVLGVHTRTTNPSTGEKEADCYFGQLTIIADGYASKFRKQYINKTPVVKSKFYALELIDCPMPAPNHGIVVLSDISPVLLYQIGTHETRALIDVPENTPSASASAGGVRNYIHNTVLPILPPEVRPCFLKALEDGKIPRSMPNSWLPPSTQTQKGVLLLGDAMNMRHPLTGGGMTVAFNDVVLLSSLLAPEKIPSLGDTAAITKAMKEFHWRRKSLSSIINILAQALYALFAANDPQLKALQKGCFHYFRKGGNCIEGPAGLLAGIIRQPLVLIYHFFAVAVLAIWIMMGEIMGGISGVWKAPLAVEQSVEVFWKACVVIFPFIWSEMRS
ncbi:Squalene epoxidase [Ciborinia camelliae]|nr:Squalene epoxidase [Ciborinia camelliae]